MVRVILTRTYPIRHRDLVLEAAALFDLDPFLILSVIKVESNFDEMAVSPRGAVGLMQVMPDTANWIVHDVRPSELAWASSGNVSSELNDARHNIFIGSWYLRYLIGRFGDLRLALAAYNSGQGRVSTWLLEERVRGGTEFALGDIPFAETRDFVNRVLAVMEWYERLYPGAMARD
jgi:soluble lytic murein transglycosylase